MDINFADFRNSQFFKDVSSFMKAIKGLHEYKHTEGHLAFNVLTIDNDYIIKRKNQNLTLTDNLHVLKQACFIPHLHFFLNSPYIPENFKNLIIDQWIEVETVIQTISQRPIYSLLLICEPGANVDYHDHGNDCKQTITFNYKFFEEKDDSIEDTVVVLNDNKIKMPEIKKTYFTMIDNPRHAARFKEWNFLWVYDFNDYINIPNITEFNRVF